MSSSSQSRWCWLRIGLSLRVSMTWSSRSSREWAILVLGRDIISVLLMYFSDAPSLESHLHNDWNTLIRNLKRRQDQYFELLQYNRSIVTKKRQENTSLFVNDEIVLHQSFLADCLQSHRDSTREEALILDKYHGCVAKYEEIIKFMARVGARIIQTCQASLQNIKALDEDACSRHSKMKNCLIKLLNQKTKIEIGQVTVLIIDYASAKMKEEIDKLQRLIKSLENGEIDRLEYVYIGKEPQQPKIKEKSVEKEKSVKKEDHLSQIKEEIKRQEKAKKQRQRLATRFATGLYSMLDVYRPQLVEDFGGAPTKQRYDRIYNEVFVRNRLNHEQILAFEAKKDLFEERVRMFKEQMEGESKRITEVLVRRPIIPPAEKQFDSNATLPEVEEEALSERGNPEAEDSFPIDTQVTRESPRKTERDTFMLRSTQANFMHIKFDSTGQEVYPRTNRARLPQISAPRGSSFDCRINSTRIKPKDEKTPRMLVERTPRTNMQLKNVEVGVHGVIRKEEGKPRQSRAQQGIVSPLEYTFYVRRSTNKFFEPRLNNIY